MVNAVLKQLHILAADETLEKLLELQKAEKAKSAEDKKGPEGLSLAYKTAATAVIASAGIHHEVRRAEVVVVVVVALSSSCYQS